MTLLSYHSLFRVLPGLLLIVAASVSPPIEAQAQEGAFLAFFDEDRLPQVVASGDQLGEMLAESLRARYEGERPVEAVLVGALLHRGELVGEFRSRPFLVEPGQVRFPDGYSERLFPDDYSERLFPDDYFGLHFSDSTFMPGDVQECLGRHWGPALFVALLPADEDRRERTASRAAVLTLDADRDD